MFYYRLCKTVNDTGILVPHTANIHSYIDDPSAPWFQSVYKYNSKQYEQFENTGSVAGITDVVGNRFIFDLDNETSLETAKDDTIEACIKLEELGFNPDGFQITFSGMKGFGVEITLDKDITPIQHKELAFKVAGNLTSFDQKVYNASRILRVPGTKHEVSGLWKTYLKADDLMSYTIKDIEKLSSTKQDYAPDKLIQSVPSTLEFKKSVTKVEPVKAALKIDYSNKPSGWSNCKWAMSQGYQVKPSDRHHKLHCLVATAKGLGYSKEQAYYIIKNAMEQGVKTYGGDKVEKRELWTTVDSTYVPTWQGGLYSCKDGKTEWLTALCESLGHNACDKNAKEEFLSVGKVFNQFESFAENIEKNTIKTGIESLDRNARFRTGQMIGLLGAPSSGKSTCALQILKKTSAMGIPSVFYSLDMADSELFQKIVQNVTEYNEQEIYHIFKTDPKRKQEILEATTEAFKNVKFSFNTGVSAEAIERSVLEYNETHDEPAKLLLIDYNELIAGPHSDATANSGHIAGLIKKLTNKLNVCTIVLLQPPKVRGDASDELDSYRAIKGSSLLEQCFSVILGIYRPGFSPVDDSEDRFMVLNCLKNRMGRVFSIPYYWNGARGEINEIDEQGEQQLERLKDKKKQQKAERGGMLG